MNQLEKKKPGLKKTVAPKKGKPKLHPAEALKREKKWT